MNACVWYVCLFVCVCKLPHVCDTPGHIVFPLVRRVASYQGPLDVSRSPPPPTSGGPVEAAISTQRKPPRQHERPFILHSAPPFDFFFFFFNQHSSSTCFSGQIASFVFVYERASARRLKKIKKYVFSAVSSHLQVFILLMNLHQSVTQNEAGTYTHTHTANIFHWHLSQTIKNGVQKKPRRWAKPVPDSPIRLNSDYFIQPNITHYEILLYDLRTYDIPDLWPHIGSGWNSQ